MTLDAIVTANRNSRAGRTRAAYHRAYRATPEYLEMIEQRRDVQRLAILARDARRGVV